MFVIICVCGCVHVSVGIHRGQQRALNPLELELVKGGCELLNWSAGHQTQVLCKINNHSKIGPIKVSSFWDTNQ